MNQKERALFALGAKAFKALEAEIIAAYQAKLRQGVELHEASYYGVFDEDFLPVHTTVHPSMAHDHIKDAQDLGYDGPEKWFVRPLYMEDQAKHYGDARDQAGYIRGLEDAKRVCERAGEPELGSKYQGDVFAAAIEKLKGGE